MRVITEENAKIIIEVMQEQIYELEKQPKNSLRIQNKIRLMRLSMDLQKNKISKNQIKK
ncbi:MAG: hypothetical protein ACK5M3_06870 [Dysgonomonas sp.]